MAVIVKCAGILAAYGANARETGAVLIEDVAVSWFRWFPYFHPTQSPLSMLRFRQILRLNEAFHPS